MTRVPYIVAGPGHKANKGASLGRSIITAPRVPTPTPHSTVSTARWESRNAGTHARSGRGGWLGCGSTLSSRDTLTDAKDSSDRLVHVWADSAYQGSVEFARAILSVVVAIVMWKKKPKGFKVQKRRWVVERTFGWLTRWRRLNRNTSTRWQAAGRSFRSP
jgi:transposase